MGNRKEIRHYWKDIVKMLGRTELRNMREDTVGRIELGHQWKDRIRT